MKANTLPCPVGECSTQRNTEKEIRQHILSDHSHRAKLTQLITTPVTLQSEQ